MFSDATKVTIIAEQLLQDGITDILKKGGAKGFTVVPGAGQGEHGQYHGGNRPSVVNAFSIVRIEFILANDARARTIAEEIAKTYFEDYAGIVYVSRVEIIRTDKF